MSGLVIRQGDVISHGGFIGQPTHMFVLAEGKVVARADDMAVCSQHGSTTINGSTCSQTTLIAGKGVATATSLTNCGASIVSTAIRTMID